MAGIKTIIFDFDGTLADTWEPIFKILNELSSEFGWRQIEESEIPSLKEKSFREIIKELNVPIFKLSEIKKKADEKMLDYAGNVSFFPGIRELLVKLKAGGFKLGILSFTSSLFIKKFFEKEDLGLFDFVSLEKTALSKERTLKKFLRQSHIKPEEVLYVGDEIRDIELAKKCKVKISSVEWGFNSEDSLRSRNPDFFARKPEDILYILENQQ